MKQLSRCEMGFFITVYPCNPFQGKHPPPGFFHLKNQDGSQVNLATIVVNLLTLSYYIWIEILSLFVASVIPLY